TFKNLNLGAFRISINNRKAVLGRLEALNVADASQKDVLIAIDKIHKIGREKVIEELKTAGLSPEQAAAFIEWSGQKVPVAEFVTNAEGELEKQGMQELSELIALIPEEARRNFVFDPSLVRGLDYYTGLIFEV